MELPAEHHLGRKRSCGVYRAFHQHGAWHARRDSLTVQAGACLQKWLSPLLLHTPSTENRVAEGAQRAANTT